MKRFCLSVLLLSVLFHSPRNVQSTSLHFGAAMDPSYNFKEGRDTVEPNVLFEFGNNPRVEWIPLVPGASAEKNIIDNLDFLKERGFTMVSMPAVGGYGELFVDTPILRGITHEGFNYDSQYVDPMDIESALADGLTELTAKQRFAFYGNLVPLFASEANKRGLEVDINFESLAHIISRAEGEGIGADSREITIAGNLPSLSPEQVGQFLEELQQAVLAVDPTLTQFSVSEEAFSDEYVSAISETTRRLGITHRHTGPIPQGWGDVWDGYYYAFYPLSRLQMDIYRFLIVLASTPPVEATTFGAARSFGKKPELVVGHYTPWPSAPDLSIEDLYDPNRLDEELDLDPISANDPMDRNGNLVQTRTAGLQKNYFLYGLISEHISDYFFSVDLDPAFDALSKLDLNVDIIPQMNEFTSVLEEQRPIVNVIIDQAVDQGNDLLTNDNEISDFTEDMGDVLQLSLSEPIFAAISAAGFEPWVTYNAPLQGRQVDAYWIITAGGGEEIEEDESTESPPFWTHADDLDNALLDLVDPSKTDTPVIISTMAGLPNSGNWAKVREIFTIPPGRGGTPNGPAYSSKNLTDDPNYQTSLATDILTDGEGEPLLTETGETRKMDLLPETIIWDGHEVRLRGFDPSEFGICVNVISPDEVPPGNVLLASSASDQSDWLAIHNPDDNGENVVTTFQKTVYIFRNGNNGKKILINPNIYHLDMLYPLSNILCDITGRPRIMNLPSTAYVAGGRTTAVFAVDDTLLDLNLPLQEDPVMYNKFDRAGNRVVTNELTSKADLFPLTLSAHELAVFGPPGLTPVDNWMIFH